SKEGFETYKLFGYQFVGGADTYLVLPDVGIPARPAYPVLVERLGSVMISLSSVKRSAFGYHRVLIYGELSPASSNTYTSIFFGRDSTVSDDTATFVASAIIARTGRFQTQIDSVDILGFGKGDRVFVAAYQSYVGLPQFPAVTSWWDPVTKQY